MSKATDYQRGYSAGRKYDAQRIRELEIQLTQAKENSLSRKDQLFMRCLEMAIKHCNGWEIGKKPVNNTEMYCKLAKAFADNAISVLDE